MYKNIEKLLGADKLTTLKKLLFGEQKFAEATLTDGTVIMWDGELAIGTEIFVITEEGQVAAPDGDHQLEDGTIITTEGGIVVDMKEPEGEPGEPATIDEEMAKTVLALGERITALENALKASTQAMANQKKANQEILNVIEKLAAAPSADPIEPKKTFMTEAAARQKEAQERLIQSLKNLKKK